MSRTDLPPPSTSPTEKEVLVGFLDYLRECVVAKVQGVAEPLVRQPGVPSGTNLLGLLKHLTYVERFTFLGEHVHDWPSTFHADPNESVSALVAAYRATTADANSVIAAWEDLSAPSPRPSRGGSSPSMRWALTHMIEETARHAGHLDILRELTDGAVGRG
ncbi:MAG: DinB family protein [Mycobacterium sp.]